jgi:hypothetical protein
MNEAKGQWTNGWNILKIGPTYDIGNDNEARQVYLA